MLLVVIWLAVTVYAIADWARTPEDEMPGRIPRMLWLVILLLTIPSFSIGSLVWLIVRAISRSEARDSGAARVSDQRPLFPRPAHASAPEPAPEPVAPDDDPEFLFRLERDIRRRRIEEERRRRSENGRENLSGSDGSRPSQSDDDGAGGSSSDQDHGTAPDPNGHDH